MNSINKQQEEDNREDLSGKEAAEKIKLLAEKATSCFFCTDLRSGKPFATRPMSVQQVDEEGNVWFLMASDSNTVQQLENDPIVQLLFQGSHHSDFLSLFGKATVNTDKAKIKEFWSPFLKTWFTEGEDDPRIRVVKTEPEDGYYWDTKHGGMIAFAKQVVGAVLGKTIDDSIEGTLKV
ncbi:MAG: pyridoxamine 5'-phosphate oxidase family protein [Ferruginibacter sp.]